MPKKSAFKCLALIAAMAALQGCGGGGSGGFFFPIQANETSKDPISEGGESAAPETPPGLSPTPEGSAFLQRALDLVNPVAVNGELDVRLSPELATASYVTYSLQKPDGSGAVSVPEFGGSAGKFFPTTRSLVKLKMPSVEPGSYVLKAKATAYDMTNFQAHEVEAALPIELNGFWLRFGTLAYASGTVIGGDSRFLNYEYQSAENGMMFVYALGQPEGVCPSRTADELAALPGGVQHEVTASPNSVPNIMAPGAAFADADTLCVQFVRSRDAVAESPYTFNLRYQTLPADADVVLVMNADPAVVPKTALNLMALPKQGAASSLFGWLDRRQLFTSGDVREQTTDYSPRMSLESAGNAWQYRLSAPIATDPPYFLAKIEGRPPTVFFVNR